MERVKVFYWRAPLMIPIEASKFETLEMAWIHDANFIGQEGDGWRVISNSVLVVLPDEGQIVMATTMAQKVDDAIPDSI